MCEDEEWGVPSVEELIADMDETSREDSGPGCPDDCTGCVCCLPLLAARRVPKSTAFTLAVYTFVADEDSDRPDELAAEAYGMLLPDGRAVTYCQEPDRSDPKMRMWPSVEKAANYWGAYVLWEDLNRYNRARLAAA